MPTLTLTLILTNITKQFTKQITNSHQKNFTFYTQKIHMMQMNNTPLYRNYWGMPSQQERYNKVPSKVVNIPVHFVGSERSRDESAIKIQKVVRGFIVRSTMKRIMGISFEVDKIEAKVHDSLEVIKRDQKERVRVSETIMNLLLKLDSVRVLNYCFGVRECRKSVIKKAIALQEMVDQIVGSNVEEQPLHGDEGESGESDCVGESQGQKMEENEGNCLVKEENVCVGDSQGEKMQFLRDEENKEEEMEVEEKEESVGTSLVEENNCVVKEVVDEDLDQDEEHDDDDDGDGDNNGGCVRKEGRHREMLERMVEDNEKMMAMMSQLYEKNEMQTRLLTSLSQRVEQLERAFACEKLRRCSKRRNVDTKQQKQSQLKNGSI